MFSRQTPQLTNSVTEAGFNQEQVEAFQQILGNCAQALEHRGPVSIGIDTPDSLQFLITQVLPIQTYGLNPANIVHQSITNTTNFPAAVIANNPGSYVDASTLTVNNGAALVANGVSILNGDTIVGGNLFLNGGLYIGGLLFTFDPPYINKTWSANGTSRNATSNVIRYTECISASGNGFPFTINDDSTTTYVEFLVDGWYTVMADLVVTLATSLTTPENVDANFTLEKYDAGFGGSFGLLLQQQHQCNFYGRDTTPSGSRQVGPRICNTFYFRAGDQIRTTLTEIAATTTVTFLGSRFSITPVNYGFAEPTSGRN
jgi:hypothetical protein